EWCGLGAWASNGVFFWVRRVSVLFSFFFPSLLGAVLEWYTDGARRAHATFSIFHLPSFLSRFSSLSSFTSFFDPRRAPLAEVIRRETGGAGSSTCMGIAGSVVG
ncbi:hypothetical protein C8F04DRAFT_1102470, partial [Mycena alexandri]